ncbi:basic proline-rich protein-like [Perognathus longimembris pacificus]|uniref:basic proline-rich protein-like n=1 Tax=Perognathus longimembris pacificus TaxID=214514 RepID=UPI0020193185|nr:basic proline-rich protein-like [Perognathus longimembris pacificus]
MARGHRALPRGAGTDRALARVGASNLARSRGPAPIYQLRAPGSSNDSRGRRRPSPSPRRPPPSPGPRPRADPRRGGRASPRARPRPAPPPPESPRRGAAGAAEPPAPAAHGRRGPGRDPSPPRPLSSSPRDRHRQILPGNGIRTQRVGSGPRPSPHLAPATREPGGAPGPAHPTLRDREPLGWEFMAAAPGRARGVAVSRAAWGPGAARYAEEWAGERDPTRLCGLRTPPQAGLGPGTQPALPGSRDSVHSVRDSVRPAWVPGLSPHCLGPGTQSTVSGTQSTLPGSRDSVHSVRDSVRPAGVPGLSPQCPGLSAHCLGPGTRSALPGSRDSVHTAWDPGLSPQCRGLSPHCRGPETQSTVSGTRSALPGSRDSVHTAWDPGLSPHCRDPGLSPQCPGLSPHCRGPETQSTVSGTRSALPGSRDPIRSSLRSAAGPARLGGIGDAGTPPRDPLTEGAHGVGAGAPGSACRRRARSPHGRDRVTDARRAARAAGPGRRWTGNGAARLSPRRPGSRSPERAPSVPPPVGDPPAAPGRPAPPLPSEAPTVTRRHLRGGGGGAATAGGGARGGAAGRPAAGTRRRGGLLRVYRRRGRLRTPGAPPPGMQGSRRGGGRAPRFPALTSSAGPAWGPCPGAQVPQFGGSPGDPPPWRLNGARSPRALDPSRLRGMESVPGCVVPGPGVLKAEESP